MGQLKSQLFGILLALATAVGCIFYEKIVQNFSFATMMFILLIETSLLVIVGLILFPNQLVEDYTKFISDSKYSIWALCYILTGITSVCWYIITKNQGIMVGSLYEVKYIVMLAIIYILFSDNKFTLNTGIGLILALTSVYFISKD